MPMPPTCTAKRNSSSLSFGSQTGRARALADLLAANLACPALGAVCITCSVLVRPDGPQFPGTWRWHTSSVAASKISRHRVFPRCGPGFSCRTVNAARPRVWRDQGCGASVARAVLSQGKGGCASEVLSRSLLARLLAGPAEWSPEAYGFDGRALKTALRGWWASLQPACAGGQKRANGCPTKPAILARKGKASGSSGTHPN